MPKDVTEKKSKKERRKSEAAAHLPVDAMLVDAPEKDVVMKEAEDVEIVVKVWPCLCALLLEEALIHACVERINQEKDKKKKDRVPKIIVPLAEVCLQFKVS